MSAPRAIVLSELMRGKSFELVNDLYTIGRTEDNDICIPDGTLSSAHCQLIKDGDTFRVVDAGSTNGTRINGEKISECFLKSSDILQVGGIEVLYDCEDQSMKQSNTTQTNINLDLDFDSPMKELTNINPIKSTDVKADKGTGKSKGFLAIIVILVLVVLVLLYFVWDKLIK
jgi:pSer/pThr/pTyr-binding forkhead associated (FHA) protein